MAGRIRDEDVALVRERARIDEVIGEHVQLRNAGGGSLKGLCPFHDEKSPSFSVTPSRGLYYCFGCAAGGDVFDFLRGIEHLTFAEAVERLGDRYGVQLRYAEGTAAPGRDRAPKTRSVEANRAAREYFVERLANSAEAEIGRAFLAERGFDRGAIEAFGVGYAPNSWDALTQHLRGKGFSADEMLAAGLLSQGQRGSYDRFRGRLIWPIQSVSGDVVGFGARRLREDDDGPKYLNTPETSLYHKSEILYGIDLAKREIAKQQRVVIVEGYTDVMACHLAGIGTAVATCGTSFGEDHVRVLRRLLMDSDELRGEVIFTFDGDEAGRKAAVRAFTEDRRFVTQLFVAVQPDGLDPCDLWQQRGAQALQDLVASRTPLAEFVIRSVLAGYDLETPAGRIAGLRAAAPFAAQTKDQALRGEYVRTLAGWLGMEIEPVRAEVQAAVRASGRNGPAGGRAGAGAPNPGRTVPGGSSPGALETGSRSTAGSGGARESGADARRPSPGDAALSLDREVLKIALQHPAAVAPAFDRLPPTAFAHPAYVAVAQAIADTGGVAGASPEDETRPGLGDGGAGWVSGVRASALNDAVRSIVTELAVEPLRASNDVDNRYATMQLASVQERLVRLEIAELRSRLQRLEPESDDYRKLFAELVELERTRHDLHRQATGG